MIDVLLTGRLRGNAAVRQAANGNHYATFRLAVADKDGQSLLCSCIAFEDAAIEAVTRLDDGDTVAVAGEASINAWADKSGNTRHGLDVRAYQAMSSYHACRKRPSGNKGEVDHGL